MSTYFLPRLFGPQLVHCLSVHCLLLPLLQISPKICVPMAEIEMRAVRSSGPGGQNVNKVSSAIYLRFDITRSSLPEYCKARLLRLADSRIARDGIIHIKARRFRTQERNREDALERLSQLLRRGLVRRPQRRKTQPSRATRMRRVDLKTRRGRVKADRRRDWRRDS